MSLDNTISTPDNARTTSPLVEVARFLQVVRHRIVLLFFCIFVGGTLGSFQYYTATRKYDSSAEILILKTEGSVLEGKNNSEQRAIQDVMPTHQRILTSDDVLERAIKKLPSKHRIDIQGLPKSVCANVLRSGISVSYTRMTNVLNIRYVSKSPQSAAVVVNAIVGSYLELMKDIHLSSSNETLVLLTKEKGELERKLADKEDDLLALKRSSGVLLQGNDKNTNVVIERTIKLNDALVEAQKKTLEARAFLNALGEALRNGSDIAQFVQQAAGDVSRELLLNSMGIGSTDAYSRARLEEQLLSDRAELKKRQVSYGQNHPQVQQLENRIRTTEQWISERSQVTAASMKVLRDRELGPRIWQMAQQRLSQATAHEAAIRAEFERERGTAMNMNNDMAKMEIVELDLRRMRNFYDLVLDQMKKIDMGSNSGLKIKVVSEPRVNLGKISPKLSMTVLLSLFMGVTFGLGLIYVLDALDDRFRSPDELQWQLGLPMLAMIRRMEPLEGTGMELIVTHMQPNSVESEAFRSLRNFITFSNEPTQRLVVTSTEPGDGKTTTLANLAVAFAQAGKKTLLIDADLRRPGMTQLLDLKGPRGLAQVLNDKKLDIDIAERCLENVFHLGVEGLDFMPSGPRPANPSELLSSERFSDIIAWAEQIYDQILIDAPPVLAVTDPSIIGRIVDGAIVVVRPDKNRRKMVTRAIDSFRTSGVKVIGLVANHVAVSSNSDYGYGYGYGYGHDTPLENDTDHEDEQPYRRAA